MLKTATSRWTHYGRYHLLAKTLLVMKLTALLLTAAFLNVSAKGISQNVTFSGKNIPLEKVFAAVEKQTGYFFLYPENALKKSKKVTIIANQQPLLQFLESLFLNQPLKYSIESRTINVSTNINLNKNLNISQITNLNTDITIDASGTVVDEQGKPVEGATIRAKKGNAITLTDAKGHFTLKGVDAGDIIIITFVGFASKQLHAESAMGPIKLDLATSPLDEVVVRAYDKTSQRLATGNITTITAKQIEKQPVTNPLLALQGQVPGLIISQSSGFANSGVTVQIQGPNSILKGNTPFYVVDGVPYPSQNLPGINTGVLGASGNGGMNPGGSPVNGFGAQNGNPLSFINPADIESISILKDGDATAIYGSQAANGAIVITTKKGKAGANKVSFNIQQGISQNARFLNIMHREQYLQMRKDAFTSNGLSLPSIQNNPNDRNYDLNGVWDNTRETDWQKILLGGTAKYTNATSTLSGGTIFDQYLISVTYNRQTTVLPTKLADQKGSLHVNLNHSSQDGRFKAQLSLQYMLDNNRLPISDLASKAFTLSPVAPALYSADGTLNWQTVNNISTWSNPMANFNSKALINTYNLVSNLQLKYQLASGFILSSNFGYTNNQQNELRTFPTTLFSPESITLYGQQPFSQFSNGYQKSWIIEPRLEYNCATAIGKLNAYVNGTLRQNTTNFQTIIATGYTSDLLLEDLKSATTVTGTTINSLYRYIGLSAHLDYNLDDKYIVSVNTRRDGSSRFGSNNSFHNFWSIAGGWIFSEERPVKQGLSFVSFGKLNVSYGTTGNDNIGDYVFLNTYSSQGASATYQGFASYKPDGLPNSNIQWEESRKLNSGLKLGFLKDRLLLDVNYYRTRSANQLIQYSLPPSAGFPQVARNFDATVQNSGWEFMFNFKPFQHHLFQWSSNFNVSFNRNKLISFPGLATSSYANNLRIGQPIDISLVARLADVDPQTGLYRFYRVDGSLTSTPSNPTDYVLISLLPKYIGGWSNHFSYKGISLDVLLQFSKQKMKNNLFIGSYFPGNLINQPAALNYWTKPGDISSTQRVTSSYVGSILSPYFTANGSDALYKTGAYARVKNITVSYQFNESISKKAGIRGANLFCSGQNLLTFTAYKGLDPESGSTALPPLRVITLGLQVEL